MARSGPSTVTDTPEVTGELFLLNMKLTSSGFAATGVQLKTNILPCRSLASVTKSMNSGGSVNNVEKHDLACTGLVLNC